MAGYLPDRSNDLKDLPIHITTMKPTVTIIIPNYNRGALLVEAVESCLSQAGVMAEVIIVDDGSTDGSGDAVGEAYPQIKLIRQENRGACVARNRGVREGSGQFVKFLDSDDKLAPDSLSKQVKALQSSDVDVVYGDFEFFGELSDPRVGGKPVRVTGAVADPVDALLGDWWCAPFCYLYRREALDGIEWWPQLDCLQDFDFILNVAMAGKKFLYQPGVSGYYRMHGGQITNTSPEKYAVNRCRILDKTVLKLREHNQLTENRRNLLAHGYWSAARAYYRSDRERFDDSVQKVYDLVPGFSPMFWAPQSVRWLTGVLGIERAERLLSMRRKILGKA